jgi:phosphate transport system protein
MSAGDPRMNDAAVIEDHQAAIDALKRHVAQMSALAVQMVADGSRALLDNDSKLAQEVVNRDTGLDKFDVDTETETMRLMAVIQPEGSVLRTLGAVLKIANCIDRVGRLGYDLARLQSSGPQPTDQSHKDLLREMDRHGRAMVERAVRAFVDGNAKEAKQVFAMDDDVDALYLDVQKRLIALLQKGGLSVEGLAADLLAARHLERVADNACKIAEKAVYAITGERRTEYFPALAHRTPAGRIVP